VNVIKKFYDNLPAHWQQKIKDNNWFDLSQFKHTVQIQFEDGSNCWFNYAFVVEDEERKELAVFTEHSGYYVFATGGMKWELRWRT